MKKTPLEEAIEIVGSARLLADRIGVTSMAITQWKKRGVPAHRVQSIVAACSGAVSAEDLRPDIFRTAAAS
ncbi:transcriptional regulator [Spongiibacter tropicus]|uniref:transcriptional regulator n=1 Tax=Spongiibacter tropicus TaxID=454602 RepID=UPI0039C9BAA0